jgi:hypothetical protein
VVAAKLPSSLPTVRRDEGRIGFRLCIGVTGHRRLEDPERVRAAVAEGLPKLVALYKASDLTPVRVVILSALAEGADRVAVRAAVDALASDAVELEAVLPMMRADYLETFERPEGAAEFEELVGAAARTRVLTGRHLRTDDGRKKAYARLGEYLVEASDCLIAVWDGREKQGEGGTAEVVQRAEAAQLPCLVVPPDGDPSGIDLRPGARVKETRAALADLDRYNGTSIAVEEYRDALREEQVRLEAPLAGTPLGARAAGLLAWVLPPYVRADLLAVRYQRRYNAVGYLIHLLSALAVTAVAAQVAFDRGTPEWLAFEIVLMLLLVVMLQIGRMRRLLDRWIGYRSLAEAFRSAAFIALAGIRHTEPSGELAATDQAWYQRAFTEAWQHRPQIELTDADVSALGALLVEGWLRDQCNYYARTARRLGRSRLRYGWAISCLAGATVVIAALHISEVGKETRLDDVFVFLAIALPAFGAALAGAREQRQLRFHEERSKRAAKRLSRLIPDASELEDLSAVRQIAARTQAVIQEEASSWSGVTEFQDLEMVV